jgi:hypothetical protein
MKWVGQGRAGASTLERLLPKKHNSKAMKYSAFDVQTKYLKTPKIFRQKYI